MRNPKVPLSSSFYASAGSIARVNRIRRTRQPDPPHASTGNAARVPSVSDARVSRCPLPETGLIPLPFQLVFEGNPC